MDIFAPCAMGGVLTENSIAVMKARIVCGASNNQLATSDQGSKLADRNILYAPDYLVNAGGIINVSAEYLGEALSEQMHLIDRRCVEGSAVLSKQMHRW
jgi:leucine dehydrogenase